MYSFKLLMHKNKYPEYSRLLSFDSLTISKNLFENKIIDNIMYKNAILKLIKFGMIVLIL